MEALVRIYMWLKVVPAPDGGEVQFHTDTGSHVMNSRIHPPKPASAGGAASEGFYLGAGLMPVHESVGHAGPPVGFFLHGLPGGTTLEQATDWIHGDEGRAWRQGASSWILMYSVATVNSY